MASAGRQISQGLRIRRAEVRFLPIVAAHFVVLGNVELALIECDAMRLIQAGENFHRPAGFAGMPGIRQRNDLALADSLTSKTPPGVKVNMRAPSTLSAKTAMWKPSGNLS